MDAKDFPPHSSGRTGLWVIPSPVGGEKFRRLNAFKITIQDDELREQIMEFELVNELTEAHIARLLELALRAPRG
jgi:hypothetical protein